MTELSGNVAHDGRPSPLASVRVVDDTMDDVVLGGVGEIVVRGGPGVSVKNSTVPAKGVSDGLRSYPKGMLSSPLDVREAGGDWTRTTFTDVDLNRRYSAAEQAKFFQLPRK